MALFIKLVDTSLVVALDSVASWHVLNVDLRTNYVHPFRIGIQRPGNQCPCVARVVFTHCDISARCIALLLARFLASGATQVNCDVPRPVSPLAFDSLLYEAHLGQDFLSRRNKNFGLRF
jgi:hypothetical protein